MLPTNGLKYTGNLKRDLFRCRRCPNYQKIGHFDKLIRHYVRDHPNYITEDLFMYASPHQYLIAIAKVQINSLIDGKKDEEPEINEEFDNYMVDMLFRHKTFKLMHLYRDKKFKKENALLYCSVSSGILDKYIERFQNHLKSLKECKDELKMAFPLAEKNLAGVKQKDIENFFELKKRTGNSSKGVFFIANFDKLIKDEYEKNNGENIKKEEIEYISDSNEEDEENEYNESDEERYYKGVSPKKYKKESSEKNKIKSKSSSKKINQKNKKNQTEIKIEKNQKKLNKNNETEKKEKENKNIKENKKLNIKKLEEDYENGSSDHEECKRGKIDNQKKQRNENSNNNKKSNQNEIPQIIKNKIIFDNEIGDFNQNNLNKNEFIDIIAPNKTEIKAEYQVINLLGKKRNYPEKGVIDPVPVFDSNNMLSNKKNINNNDETNGQSKKRTKNDDQKNANIFDEQNKKIDEEKNVEIISQNNQSGLSTSKNTILENIERSEDNSRDLNINMNIEEKNKNMIHENMNNNNQKNNGKMDFDNMNNIDDEDVNFLINPRKLMEINNQYFSLLMKSIQLPNKNNNKKTD